jgi:hypothetical protein
MKYNVGIKGKLLAYEQLEMDQVGAVNTTVCIPELKGKIVVPITAKFLCFAPEVGSTGKRK